VSTVPREGYQADLDALRTDVLALGADVVEQVEDGLTALETDDAALGRAVIDGDAAINDRYLALESDCIDLFALQQPVASDLRFVASSFKILTDLERIGDLATNFGTYAQADAREVAPDPGVIDVGRDAASMVEDALAAYETGDVERCYAIAERDDQIDALCQRTSEDVVRDLIGRSAAIEDAAGPGEDPSKTVDDSWAIEETLDDVSRLLLTIRDVERVGDHAVNVAARTLYQLEGDSTLLY